MLLAVERGEQFAHAGAEFVADHIHPLLSFDAAQWWLGGFPRLNLTSHTRRGPHMSRDPYDDRTDGAFAQIGVNGLGVFALEVRTQLTTLSRDSSLNAEPGSVPAECISNSSPLLVFLAASAFAVARGTCC